MAIESTSLQTKASQSRISIFLKTKNPRIENFALKNQPGDVRLYAFKAFFPLVYGSQY